MPNIWTENQIDAINATGGNVLVSAAAGSGKTAVLVQRVVNLITKRESAIDANRLLVVTFTRAAAAEMKERINKALEEMILNDPFNIHLHRQRNLLAQASISTIHSFCADLIRENFYELDIPQDFKIAEEGTLKILQAQAIENMLDIKYNEKNPDFYKLVESFASPKDDLALTDIIKNKLYTFLMANPFPEQWMAENLQFYEIGTGNHSAGAGNTIWGKLILSQAEPAVTYSIELTHHSVSLLAETPGLFPKIETLLSEDLAYFSELHKMILSGDWDIIVEKVKSFSPGRLAAPKGFSDHPVKLMVAKTRDIIKKRIMENLRHLFFQNNSDCISDIKTQKPIVSQLFDCAAIYNNQYIELKRKKKLVDFNDLEHLALKLLVKNTGSSFEITETAKKISSFYQAVMVDEYQDVNEVQEMIFNAVGSRRLFAVGDVKQSIYGFRQAKPQIFIRRKESSTLYNRQRNNYPSYILLDRNFRSRQDITESVNFIFHCLMSKEVGDIEYNDEERLTAGTKYPEKSEPSTELHILELSEEDEACSAEAKYIAKIIKQHMKNTLITEDNTQRHPEYGDFAILLRSGTKNSSIYVNELLLQGIPAVSNNTESFFDALEVQIILNYLRIIDNPSQDIPLVSVLMSPVYGFTPDEISVIKINSTENSFYFALRSFCLQEEETVFSDQLKIKCFNFLEQLTKFRMLAVTVQTDILINNIFEETAFLSISPVVTGNKNSTNNLLLLQDYAKTFESGENKGSSAFVSYIDKLLRSGIDLKSAYNSEGSGTNMVQVMTIHKSKGLEFPICILAGTSRKFATDSTNPVLLHNTLGFAAKRKENMCRCTTLPYEAVSLELQRFEKSEELRILYVAVTRAKEKLILLISKRNPLKYLSSVSSRLVFEKRISPYIIKDTVTLSDWILMCGLLHPDGGALRKLAGRDTNSFFNIETSKWKFVLHLLEYKDDQADLLLLSENNNLNSKNSLSHSEATKEDLADHNDNIQKFFARMNYIYNNRNLCNLPIKAAVSELAHNDKWDRTVLRKPAFADSPNLTAAEKGTAIHAFLQYCSFENARNDINKEINKLIHCGFITKRQAQAIDVNKVQKFLECKVIEEAVISKQIYREYKFTIKIDPAYIDKALEPSDNREKILLQGAIDLAYVKNGSIVLVDYKTDITYNMNSLLNSYQEQLFLYKMAMEQCTEYKVQECIIYSIFLNDYISF